MMAMVMARVTVTVCTYHGHFGRWVFKHNIFAAFGGFTGLTSPLSDPLSPKVISDSFVDLTDKLLNI
jgi:hypothetical protein